MNNIAQASKNLKKKLSFNDYTPVHESLEHEQTEKPADTVPASQHNSNPVYQHDSKPVSQIASMTEKQYADMPVRHEAVKTAYQHDSITALQYDSKPTDQHTGMTASQHYSKPVDQQAGNTANNFTSETVRHVTGKTASQHASNKSEINSSKIKATYYLTAQDYQALTQVYINRLQSNTKTDKSSLIGEAIKLLYQNELQQ